MAYSWVQRAMSLWIVTDCLPYATIDTLAFQAMLCARWTRKPQIWDERV